MYTTAVPFSPARANQLDVCETPAPWYHEPMSADRQHSDPRPPDAGSGNLERFRVAIEAGGKVRLPPAVTEHLGVTEGDSLLIEAQPDRTVVVHSLERVVQQAHGIFRDIAPGVSLVDELSAERREEARRENEG